MASLEKSHKSLEQKETTSDCFSWLMVTGTVMLTLFYNAAYVPVSFPLMCECFPLCLQLPSALPNTLC